MVDEGVTIGGGGDATTMLQEDGCNLILVSGDRANTSTITIISDLPDPSNSLASNISQVRQFFVWFLCTTLF